jgi:hypothetical protein
MSNASTSNAPPRSITVSKIRVRSCESIRWPSATTVAEGFSEIGTALAILADASGCPEVPECPEVSEGNGTRSFTENTQSYTEAACVEAFGTPPTECSRAPASGGQPDVSEIQENERPVRCGAVRFPGSHSHPAARRAAREHARRQETG